CCERFFGDIRSPCLWTGVIQKGLGYNPALPPLYQPFSGQTREAQPVLLISLGERAPFFVLLRRTPSASNFPAREPTPCVLRRGSLGAEEKGGFADGFEQEFGDEQGRAARARGERARGGRA